MYRFKILILIALVLSITTVAPSHLSPVMADRATSPPMPAVIPDTTLIASNRVAAAEFGSAVAVDGNTAVLGAPRDHGNRQNSGAAYVFQYNGIRWNEVAKLTASDGAAFDFFGRSVAISGNTIVVGANGNDHSGLNTGAAYIFEYDGSNWIETARLIPDNTTDAFFGWSVAIDGNTVVVGAPYSGSGTINSGSVSVFTPGPNGWSQSARLTTGSRGGAVGSDLFGWAVAISGNTLAVGAYLDDIVYVFESGDAGWTVTARLSGHDTKSTDRFGWAVAIKYGTIVVGAVQHDEQGNNAGAAYIFQRSQSTWSETARLTPEDFAPGSRAGWSVAISGATVVIGARESKGNTDQDEAGLAYVYRLRGATWNQTAVLRTSNPAAFDHFGAAVSVSGAKILVGAPGTNQTSSRAGAVHTYLLQLHRAVGRS